jgi:hypothetical protein
MAFVYLHLLWAEEKQNETLLLLSTQILELTQAIHALTKAAGGPVTSPPAAPAGNT